MPKSLHDEIMEMFPPAKDSSPLDKRIRNLALLIARHVEGERVDPSTLVPRHGSQEPPTGTAEAVQTVDVEVENSDPAEADPAEKEQA